MSEAKYKIAKITEGSVADDKKRRSPIGNGAAEMSANGYFVNLFWCFNAPEAS